MKDIGGMVGMRDTSLWCMRDIGGMGGMRVMGGMGGSEGTSCRKLLSIYLKV